jgi:hypothetical protein
MLLAEYNIVYMTRKTMKWSIIADHLADNAILDYEPLSFYFSDEDVLVVEKRSVIILLKENNTLFWSSYSLSAPIIQLIIKLAL